MTSRVRKWRVDQERAEMKLQANERRVVDIARRLSRLEAEVELAERAQRRGSQ